MVQAYAWAEEVAPRSEVRSRSRDVVPASRRLWNLDWRRELPWRLGAARAECATLGEVLAFVGRHYPTIFGQDPADTRFLCNPMNAAKTRFFEEMDLVRFGVGGETVGVFMGHPTDWSTYYVRSIGLMRQHRQLGVATRFFERLPEPLRAHGVERIEIECSPANAAMSRLLTGQGYVVTGSVTSERWGVLLRYTKFLREEAHEVFVRQFAAMSFDKRRTHTTPESHRSEP